MIPRRFPALCLLAVTVVLGPSSAAAVTLTEATLNVGFPPNRALVTKAEIVVTGRVLTPDVTELEIVVNDGRPVFAGVRDTVFAEEVGLDDGLNVIRIGSLSREVWLATDREKAPAGFRRHYGHVDLEDGCLECHEADAEAGFALAGEREEICAWCHGDVVRGARDAPWVSTHAPVRAGKCLQCHGPHTSDRPGLPAAAPSTCASCHPDVLERMKTDRFVHGPMNLGDCRLCHDVHGSRVPKLLRRPATELCTDCHSDVLLPPGTPADLQPHTMIPEGECGRCHEPHSSANPRMLREAAGLLCQKCHEGKTRSFHEAKGFSIYVCAKCHDLHRPTQPHLIVDASRSLCVECHDFRGEALFTHSFAAEGRCFICHSFHEAPLPREVAATCLACHRDNPQLSSAHRGFPIEHARCTSCHQPHSAQRSKLLRVVEHTPFARRECDGCHRGPAGPGGGPPPRQCLDCHRDKDLAGRAEAPAFVHEPFREKPCAECHGTHNANEAGMLREAPVRLCLGCHRTMRKATLLTPVSAHTAVTGGRCGACHDPHFSSNGALLREPPGELCRTCHAAVVRAPGGEAWPQPHRPVEEGKCRLCHKPHTSSNAALLKAPSPQGCRPCHVPFFAETEASDNRSVHAPVRDGDCDACHQVHGGSARLLAPGSRRELCAGCHKVLKDAHHALSAEQIAASGGEAATASGCLFCHRPHSSRRQRLLQAQSGPCKACHEL